VNEDVQKCSYILNDYSLIHLQFDVATTSVTQRTFHWPGILMFKSGTLLIVNHVILLCLEIKTEFKVNIFLKMTAFCYVVMYTR
jgi:hypothetical protein